MIHLNIPEVLTDNFRVLPKRCRKFDEVKCNNFEQALYRGMNNYPQGFRVFRQKTYEWHDPLNIEVAKISDSKKWIVDKTR